ncbi:MAG: zinc finger Ran-binding domain-containing protein, partial [bacterium]
TDDDTMEEDDLQEEEEQKAMEAMEQLQACNSEVAEENDIPQREVNDDEESSSDDTSDNDGTQKDPMTIHEDNSKVDESWYLHRVIPSHEIQLTSCKTDECKLCACSVWKSNKGEEWFCCLDCQNEDFGPWPDKMKPSKVELDFIEMNCTQAGVDSSSGLISNMEVFDEEKSAAVLVMGDKENQLNRESLPVVELTPLKARKPSAQWNCKTCTFTNKASARKCAMCTTRKRASDASSPMSTSSKSCRVR